LDTTVLVIIVAVVALVLIAGLVYMNQSKSRKELKSRFGPEYDRTIQESGRGGERELKEREQRVEKLRLKDLGEDDRRRFADEWRMVQAHFVDDPSGAIGEADSLVQDVMDKRGYPITDFEQQAADISVNHPQVVSNYRSAHEIAESHKRDGVNTEGLRQAMIHYRALFDELLGTPVSR